MYLLSFALDGALHYLSFCTFLRVILIFFAAPFASSRSTTFIRGNLRTSSPTLRILLHSYSKSTHRRGGAAGDQVRSHSLLSPYLLTELETEIGARNNKLRFRSETKLPRPAVKKPLRRRNGQLTNFMKTTPKRKNGISGITSTHIRPFLPTQL